MDWPEKKPLRAIEKERSDSMRAAFLKLLDPSRHGFWNSL